MEKVLEILNQLKSTTKTNEKLAILKQHSDNELLKEILYYTYSDNLQYGFSEKKLRELLEENQTKSSKWDNPFDMFEELSKCNINDELRNNVIGFLASQSEDIRELYIRVLCKDMRCNISNKTIDKVWKGLLPKWEVQQGYPLEKVKLKKDEWIALSLKLNGIRSTYFKGEFKSRQNKLMTGFDHIKADIEKLEEFTGYVFDGEMIRNNIDNIPDNENFRLTTSIVNSDTEDKSEIQLVIFDMLPTDEFIQGSSSKTFKHRMVEMMRVKEIIYELGLKNIDVAPIYYNGTDHTRINKILDIVDNQGMEGLMLLRDMKYKCKRHNGCVKCKKFKEIDCKVVGYEEGSGRLENTLGALVVEYKGNTINVGSGYDDFTRKELWENRDEIIGRYITVKYKEETMDKKTKMYSLQFPIYIKLKEIDEEINGDK